ncbi:MAG: phage portal protein [Bacteroidales bacterium]|nr:phage portal protein [Bacteroidales bacterium]
MDFFSVFRKREVSSLEGIDDSVLKKSAGSLPAGSSFKKKIIFTGGAETAMRVAAVYRAAQVRAGAMSMLKLRYLMRDRSHSCYVEPVDPLTGRNSRLNYILQVRPNSRQNASQFWEVVELMRMFNGNCCILPRYDYTGQISELIPCDGRWDDVGNYYTLSAPTFGVYGEGHPADEVIVIRGAVSQLHPNGESIIHYAARTTSLSATSEELALENAGKGGRQKIIIQQKENDGFAGLGALDGEEMEKQARKLQNAIYEEDVVYDHSFSSITPINMNAVDMQLLETRKFTIADIARFFGVPRALLMDDSNSNYKTAEAASLDFLSRTLAPLMKGIEDEFNAKVLTSYDYGLYKFQFDARGLMMLDITTLGAYNKNRLETGVASVNELRAEMNMPSIEGGDEHYVSCNVAPVGSAKLSGNTEGGSDEEA